MGEQEQKQKQSGANEGAEGLLLPGPTVRRGGVSHGGGVAPSRNRRSRLNPVGRPWGDHCPASLGLLLACWPSLAPLSPPLSALGVAGCLLWVLANVLLRDWTTCLVCDPTPSPRPHTQRPLSAPPRHSEPFLSSSSSSHHSVCVHCILRHYALHAPSAGSGRLRKPCGPITAGQPAPPLRLCCHTDLLLAAKPNLYNL